MALGGAGKTDKEIAEDIGVARGTLALWKNKTGTGPNDCEYTGFGESLADAKNIADDLVECALLDSAINKNNVIAQMFWLKNRKPSKWRDRHETPQEPIDEVIFDDETEPAKEDQSEEISKEKDENAF